MSDISPERYIITYVFPFICSQVIVFGEAEGYIPFESLLAHEDTFYTIPEANWKHTTCVLFSSSGTTGFPKACQMSHFAFVANMMQLL